MRDHGSIIAPSNVSVSGEIKDCALSWKRLDSMENAARELPGERLVMGRRLVNLRRHWPSRGPKAKGWGDVLAKIGIPQQTAWKLMELAGYVEANSISPSESETSTGEIAERDTKPERVPTYAEAGIDKRPRAADAPTPAPKKSDAPMTPDERAALVEENRRRSDAQREADTAHLRIEHRERAGQQWREAIESMIALKNSLPPITDVSASAEDFAIVKNLYYVLFNQVRDDLKRIDALGEPQTPPPKRQLALVPGGAE